jgi:uncharacterized protein YkwD
VRMWMASPPHRANLLDPQLRRAGVGVGVARSCASAVVTAAFSS